MTGSIYLYILSCVKRIKHTKAAELIGCNEKVLREKTPSGEWAHYTELHREQEAPRCAIWFSEEHVIAWTRSRNSRYGKPTSTENQIQRMESLGYKRMAQLLAQLS